MKVLGHSAPPSAAIGFALVAGNLVFVCLAPWIAPHGATQLIGTPWARPSAEAWLGLDNLGRDMLSRVMFADRTSIALALIITMLAFALGVAGGFAAATARRWVDLLLSRIVDIAMAVPTLIFALTVLSVLGTSVPVLIATVALLEATRVFRVSRAVAMDIAVLEYVEAARLRGERQWWIMCREILPNALPPLAAEFGLRFCFTLLFIASLSFLGLGVQPPATDLGSMVRENATAIDLGGIAPLIPAAVIATQTVGVNLLVDWFLSRHGRVHGEGL